MTTTESIASIRSRLRQDLKAYLKQPHPTKKHRTAAITEIQRLFRAARRGGVDSWTQLEALGNTGAITPSALKKAFRDHLMPLQDSRCCFCRRWLVNTAHARPIEHVLPRTHVPQFSFHYWNLAVACYDCNSFKKDDIWGNVNKKLLAYPLPGAISTWFHPRFHRYDEHVRYVRLESNGAAVVVFVGKTEQGHFLCQSLLRHIAAKEMLIANNPVLRSCVNTLNERVDQLPEGRGEKMREFQEELGNSITRLLSNVQSAALPRRESS